LLRAKLIAWHIAINRRGYSGCGGLEKVVGKSEKMKRF